MTIQLTEQPDESEIDEDYVDVFDGDESVRKMPDDAVDNIRMMIRIPGNTWSQAKMM